MADREKEGKREILKFGYLKNNKSFLFEIKHLSKFLKGFHLVKNKDLFKNSRLKLKYLKPNAKKPLEMHFRASRRVGFSYFPKNATWWVPPIPFRIFVDHVAVFSSSAMQ